MSSRPAFGLVCRPADIGTAISAVGVALFLSVLALSGARAQSTDTDVQKRETKSAIRTQETGRRASDFTADGGADVTYQDVLKDPDNLTLNFRFARAQVQRGDVRGAAATLERILLIDPGQIQIRLFYGIVLFRLGNLDEAEREMRHILDLLDTPQGIRTTAEQYMSRIAQRQRRTRYTATISMGTQYDSNRTSTPEDRRVLVRDFPLGTGRGEDDFGLLFIARFQIDHDLESQAGHSLFANVTLYDDDQVDVDSTDLMAVTVEAGGTYKSGLWGLEFVPAGFYTNLSLSKEKLLESYGGELRIQRSFGAILTVFGTARTSYQDFSRISENLSAWLRQGRQIGGEVGLSLTYMPNMRIDLSVLHFDKNAKADFFAYKREQFDLVHTTLIGGGQFLINTLALQLDRYDEADPFVSQRKRMDKIFRYRLTYGAPFKFFFPDGWLWVPLRGIVASGSFEYFRSTSNIPNYDYRNFKGQFLLSKTWSF